MGLTAHRDGWNHETHETHENGEESAFTDPPNTINRNEKAARHRPPTAVSAAVAYTCSSPTPLRPACCVAEAVRLEHWRIRVPFRFDCGDAALSPHRHGVGNGGLQGGRLSVASARLRRRQTLRVQSEHLGPRHRGTAQVIAGGKVPDVPWRRRAPPTNATRHWEPISGGGREPAGPPAAKTPGAPSTIAPTPTGHHLHQGNEVVWRGNDPPRRAQSACGRFFL